eukprot:gene9011-12153_t
MSKILPLLSVLLLASLYFFDYQSAFTWAIWSTTVVLERIDRCYFKNPFMVQLFSALEDRDLDKTNKIPATPVTIIEASDYSFKALEVLSKGWTQPVLVRGLFKDAAALKDWSNPNYLISKTFGNNSVSVIHNGTIAKHYDMVCGPQSDAEVFSEYKPFDETIRRIAYNKSLETIVYPPASRSKRIRDKEVEPKWNDMVKNDLDLARIGKVFEDQARSTVLTQMFLGGGAPSKSAEGVVQDDIPPTIGTGWHGDVCNNFVVQVTGVKKWIMVDPKYSAYMRPTMKAGKAAIVGAHLSFQEETLPYIPHHEFFIHPGDFLYNPEWYWHSIQNLPESPYALGLVSRQCHLGRNFKQSLVFSSLVVINHARAMIFDVEARMRIAGMIFGESLMQPDKAVNVDLKSEVRTGYT